MHAMHAVLICSFHSTLINLILFEHRLFCAMFEIFVSLREFVLFACCSSSFSVAALVVAVAIAIAIAVIVSSLSVYVLQSNS